MIKDERFKELSSDAKLLYGLMLDRMSLSMKNGWLDDENRAYIIYTVDAIMEDLGCAKATCVKIMKELDSLRTIIPKELYAMCLYKLFVTDTDEVLMDTLIEAFSGVERNCGSKQAEHDEALSVVWNESIKAGRQITEEYREGREKVMEYKDFVEQVKEQIQDFLPEKFADATVSVHQVVKNNDCVLDGLTIRTEESNISPTVYLNPYFEQIQDGAEMDDVLGQIAAIYQAHYIDHDMDVSAVTDFDNVKDKIVCKLINEEANRQFLEDKPYTKVEDLAAVYQILMDKNAESTATITITDNLMDRYGITLEDLNEQALLNMDVLQPYSFKGMSETIIEMMAGDIARDNGMDILEAREMASQMIPDVPDTMFVLTNDTKVNGAAAILNDDIRQEIADKVGDFYVLPSSIHETLIIPKDAGMELRDLEQMVQEVNQTQVAPQERLSDHVYEYDAKEHELFRSDRAEERIKQKEEKRDEKKERPSLKERLAEKKNDVMKMDADRKQPTADKKKEAVI